MSLIIRPSENTFIKRNRIEPTQEWSIPFQDFVSSKKYEEIKNIFSKKKYYEIISFSIQMLIADLDKEYKTNIPHNLQSLLKQDNFEVFCFKETQFIYHLLNEIEIGTSIFDENLFDILRIYRNYAKEELKQLENYVLHTPESLIENIKWRYRDIEEASHFDLAIHTEENVVMEFLLFMFFASDEELFIISDKYGLNFILTNENNLHHYLDDYSLVFNLRKTIESYFSEKGLEQFAYIREQYGKNADKIDIMKAILECIALDNIFANGKFSGKIKNGKPIILEISAHTTDRDIKKREEKLGPYRNIETNTEDDKLTSLKVTKRIKLT